MSILKFQAAIAKKSVLYEKSEHKQNRFKQETFFQREKEHVQRFNFSLLNFRSKNFNISKRVRYIQRYSQNIHNYYNQKIFLGYFEIIFKIF